MYEEYWIAYLIGSLVGIIIDICLGLIPANIAKKKGYSFGLWWLYGTFLFIIALIHACVIESKNEYNNQMGSICVPNTPKIDPSEELLKYKELKDNGALTEEEFNMIKQKLLKFL